MIFVPFRLCPETLLDWPAEPLMHCLCREFDEPLQFHK